MMVAPRAGSEIQPASFTRKHGQEDEPEADEVAEQHGSHHEPEADPGGDGDDAGGEERSSRARWRCRTR